MIAGNLGLSIKEGKAIMASLQRHIVEQQCALYVLFRRHCQGCGGTRPIKDYSTRTVQTVYGAVTMESPRVALPLKGVILNLCGAEGAFGP